MKITEKERAKIIEFHNRGFDNKMIAEAFETSESVVELIIEVEDERLNDEKQNQNVEDESFAEENFDESEYSDEVEDDESGEVDLFLEKVVSEFEKQLDELSDKFEDALQEVFDALEMLIDSEIIKL